MDQFPLEPCRYCKKKTRIRFIIGDDMENPKPYHKICYDRLMLDVMIEISRRQ